MQRKMMVLAGVLSVLGVAGVAGISYAAYSGNDYMEEAQHRTLVQEYGSFCGDSETIPSSGTYSCGGIVQVNYAGTFEGANEYYFVHRIEEWKPVAYQMRQGKMVRAEIPTGCWGPQFGGSYSCTFTQRTSDAIISDEWQQMAAREFGPHMFWK